MQLSVFFLLWSFFIYHWRFHSRNAFWPKVFCLNIYGGVMAWKVYAFTRIRDSNTHVISVVYFNQWMSAQNAVCWSKSSFWRFSKFFLLFPSQTEKEKKAQKITRQPAFKFCFQCFRLLMVVIIYFFWYMNTGRPTFSCFF